DMAREPAVLSRFASGDRSRARTCRSVAGNRSCPLGAHAWSRDGPPDQRDDGGRAALLRSGALSGESFQSVRGRELPEVVAVPDVGVEESSFRESGSKGSGYLAGNIDVFVDATRHESNGQTLAFGIIFDIGDRAGRHTGQRRGCLPVRPSSS